MNKVILTTDEVVDEQTGQATGESGKIELAPGLTVEAYLSPEDGALVVQIDTPADGEHENQHDRARVYMNDAVADHWASAA